MMNTRAVSLMEILATIIIIGILAAIAIPNFTPMRENVLDKESNASLKLIQAAQKIYRLEAGFYFPYSGTESIQGTINTNLRILLPTDDSTRKWTYRCADTASGTKSCSDSTRYNKPGDTRHWRLWVNETDQLSGECP